MTQINRMNSILKIQTKFTTSIFRSWKAREGSISIRKLIVKLNVLTIKKEAHKIQPKIARLPILPYA